MPSESERVAVKTPGEAAIVSRLLWWLAGCSGVIALVCATLAGLRFTHAGPLLSLLGAYLTILLTARVYSARRGVGDARLRLWIDVAASFTLTSLANLVLAYAAATVPAPDATDRMWRDDALYDLTFVLDQNFTRRVQGRGSAIFFHLARPGLTPTAGCIAISGADMRKLAPKLARGASFRIL